MVEFVEFWPLHRLLLPRLKQLDTIIPNQPVRAVDHCLNLRGNALRLLGCHTLLGRLRHLRSHAGRHLCLWSAALRQPRRLSKPLAIASDRGAKLVLAAHIVHAAFTSEPGPCRAFRSMFLNVLAKSMLENLILQLRIGDELLGSHLPTERGLRPRATVSTHDLIFPVRSIASPHSRS